MWVLILNYKQKAKYIYLSFQWFDSQQVIQNVVALLDPSSEPDKHSNAAQLLCDIIKVSRENQYASTERMDPNPILNTIES